MREAAPKGGYLLLLLPPVPSFDGAPERHPGWTYRINPILAGDVKPPTVTEVERADLIDGDFGQRAGVRGHHDSS